jgi:hypothetical protein
MRNNRRIVQVTNHLLNVPHQMAKKSKANGRPGSDERSECKEALIRWQRDWLAQDKISFAVNAISR